LNALEQTVAQHHEERVARALAQQQLEIKNSKAVAKLYELGQRIQSREMTPSIM